ncbi:putative cyclase domain containing protein [Tylopilus felleus]
MIYNISAPQYTPAFSLFTMPSLVIKRIFSVRNGKQEQPASPMTNANGTVSRVLPTFDELPRFQEFNGCAWEVWGKDDQLGTINLLTEDVVQRAAREEIRSGRTVSLNWPIHFPFRPAFGRKVPSIRTFVKESPSIPIRDDVIHVNTQYGSQWDGLKHFGLTAHNVFYNNTPAEALSEGEMEIHDPTEIDHARVKLGIHNWSNHGICGRGVLLDLVHYYTDGKALPYDPWTAHPISVAELEACAKKQGVTFRPADILLIRVGFIQKYYATDDDAKATLSGGPEVERFAGIEQSEDMKRFLWNNHFAAIASDQPSLERWPAPQGVPSLHQTILGLWGMPIGEFFDLEALSQVCKDTERYTFFFTSWPLNIIGGAASPPNAAAYF